MIRTPKQQAPICRNSYKSQLPTCLIPTPNVFKAALKASKKTQLIEQPWVYTYTILYYTILYCTILYYAILYYTILYYTILYYTIPNYTILYYTILYYTILYYTILYYTILYYTILYYTIPHHTTLYHSLKGILELSFQGSPVYGWGTPGFGGAWDARRLQNSGRSRREGEPSSCRDSRPYIAQIFRTRYIVYYNIIQYSIIEQSLI